MSYMVFWSNLDLYESCPQYFLWKKGWKGVDCGAGEGNPLPPARRKSEHDALMGKSIQRAWEEFYNNKLWKKPNARQAVLDVFENYFNENLATCWIDWDNPRTPSVLEMKQTCIDAINGYFQTLKHHRFLTPNSQSEIKLKGEILPGVLIGGYIDFLIEMEDGMYILDGKNSKYREKYTDKDQLIFYALCYFAQYRKLPQKLGFLYWRFPYDGEGEAGVEWVQFDQHDLKRLAKRAKDMVVQLTKSKSVEDFPARPSPSQCRFCVYEPICQARQNQIQANRKEVVLITGSGCGEFTVGDGEMSFE